MLVRMETFRPGCEPGDLVRVEKYPGRRDREIFEARILAIGKQMVVTEKTHGPRRGAIESFVFGDLISGEVEITVMNPVKRGSGPMGALPRPISVIQDFSGARTGVSKLSELQKDQIAQDVEAGVDPREVARHHNVSLTTVNYHHEQRRKKLVAEAQDHQDHHADRVAFRWNAEGDSEADSPDACRGCVAVGVCKHQEEAKNLPDWVECRHKIEAFK